MVPREELSCPLIYRGLFELEGCGGHYLELPFIECLLCAADDSPCLAWLTYLVPGPLLECRRHGAHLYT